MTTPSTARRSAWLAARLWGAWLTDAAPATTTTTTTGAFASRAFATFSSTRTCMRFPWQLTGTLSPCALRSPAAPRLPWKPPRSSSRPAGTRAFSEGGASSGGAQQQSAGAAASSGGRGAKSPISFNSMILGVAAFLGIVAVAQHKAQERVDDMMKRSQQVVGKAAVGGPFALIDQDGKPFTHYDLQGHWSVLYFGFTHCPDICPDELEKLAEAIDIVERDYKEQVLPVFITIDPHRDTPKKVKEYVKEFHPRLIGLTGSEEAIKSVSKAYRVYFNKTSDDPEDYLVDHSIITYLIDPDGEFVTFYGKNFDAQGLAKSIAGHVKNYKEAGDSGGSSSSAAAKGQAGSQEGRAQR